MHTTPFLLVAQGRRAADAAERTWPATERLLGIPLACYVVQEHNIVIYVSDVRGAAAASSRQLQRIVIPTVSEHSSSEERLVISLRQPGSTSPDLGNTDLVAASSALSVKVHTSPMAVARGTTLPYQRLGLDSSSFQLEFDLAGEAWRIARGNSGSQTLYYRTARDRNTQFAASTQLRALLRLFERRPALDHVAVSRFLCNGFFCEPETPIAEVRSLLPREVIRMDRVSRTMTLVEDLAVDDREPSAAPHALTGDIHQRVRQELIQVIESQTAQSSDTACQLSGGVDSSTVAAIASTVLGKTVHTFTLVFEDAAINEAAYASAVARRIGSKHREVLLRQSDFEGSLDWLLSSLDVPTTDGLNSLLITRAIGQEGHLTALVGVGSDELFGGHECMQRVPRALAILRALHSFPAPARSAFRSMVAHLAGCTEDPWLPSHGLRGKFLALLDGEADPLDVYLLSRRVLLPAAVEHLRPNVSTGSFATLPSRLLERIPSALSLQLHSKQISYYEQLLYLRNQLMRDLQMVGVATGVGIHAPFTDPAFVSLVTSLPAPQIFGGRRPKQFLIDCVSDVLPREAYERPKLGFVLPIGHWLGGLVTSRIRELSGQVDLLQYLAVDLAALNKVLDDCAAARGRVFYTREWSLFVLLDWCSRHLSDDRVS